MNEMEKKTRRMDKLDADPVLKQALGHFRDSVHAWSNAAYVHPRTAATVVAHRSWRLAAGWALGCVLVTGSLTGGLYEHHHRQMIAKMKADAARHAQLAAQPRVHNADEDLLATVDRDVSRAVPAAMEPLAQLMDTEANQ